MYIDTEMVVLQELLWMFLKTEADSRDGSRGRVKSSFLGVFRSIALCKLLQRVVMSCFYLICTPPCAGGFDVVVLEEDLTQAGRSLHLLLCAASVAHGILSAFAGLSPEELLLRRKILFLNFELSISGEIHYSSALCHLSEAPCPLSHTFASLVIAAHPPSALPTAG